MNTKYAVSTFVNQMVPKNTSGGALVRIIVLGWSAGLLTASYAGLLPKMDPTFIASILTASLATFGVDAVKRGESSSKTNSFSDTAKNVATNAAATIASDVAAKAVNGIFKDDDKGSVPVGRS